MPHDYELQQIISELHLSNSKQVFQKSMGKQIKKREFKCAFFSLECTPIFDRHCGRDEAINFTKLFKEGKKGAQPIMNSNLFENNALIASYAVASSESS